MFTVRLGPETGTEIGGLSYRVDHVAPGGDGVETIINWSPLGLETTRGSVGPLLTREGPAVRKSFEPSTRCPAAAAPTMKTGRTCCSSSSGMASGNAWAWKCGPLMMGVAFRYLTDEVLPVTGERTGFQIPRETRGYTHPHASSYNTYPEANLPVGIASPSAWGGAFRPCFTRRLV